jgi:hypothetical protein
MTDDHLHDEELSDAVDGLASADTTSHLAGCGQCRARVESMRAASVAVAAPPPAPSPAARDAAVAQALGVAVPSRRRAVVAPWMAAAALVAVLLGAGGIVLAGRDGGRDQTATRQLDSPTGGGSADAKAGAAAPVDAGDLGDQRDPVALNALLEERLAQPAAVAAPSLAQSSGSEAAEGAPEDAPEDASTVPAGACLAEASDAGSGRVGPLVLTARLRWQGEPAVVLVFAVPDQSQLGRRAFVMARRDCRLLVVQSF